MSYLETMEKHLHRLMRMWRGDVRKKYISRCSRNDRPALNCCQRMAGPNLRFVSLAFSQVRVKKPACLAPGNSNFYVNSNLLEGPEWNPPALIVILPKEIYKGVKPLTSGL